MYFFFFTKLEAKNKKLLENLKKEGEKNKDI